MLTPNRIKFLRSLSAKKARTDEGLFTVEGVKPVDELLGSTYKIHSVYGLPDWIAANEKRLQRANIEYHLTSQTELERISQLTTPNNVVALAYQNKPTFAVNTLKGKLVLVLDGVGDPGNMGTIIRIADWFGIDTVVCSANSVEQYNPKTVQAAMGSLFRVGVFYTDLVTFITEYKSEFAGNGVYAANLGGENLYGKPIKTPCLLVMGSESHGISKPVEKLATGLITIPSFGNSKAESLNVAVSTAIICGEIRRCETKS